MLDSETKRRIDTARDILVGKVPDPKSQVEQITIALIYKFMDDMDLEAEELGGEPHFFTGEYEKYGWRRIFDPALGGHEMLGLYGDAITRMVLNPNLPQLFRDIFKNAYLPYRDPETLKSFLKIIDDFSYDQSEKLGDAFEYLLSVLGSQGDAGQFRTPRHIIDFMTSVINPKKNETILDPACGTAGFLISAFKHIIKANSSSYNPKTDQHAFEQHGIKLDELTINGKKYQGDLLTPDDRTRITGNIRGYDISPDMVRLSLVNLYLHGFPEPHVYEYDSLTSDDRWNEFYDVILANPPFMSPKGGIRPHKRFSVQSNRSEVLFVDFMAEHLTPGGRACIIVPEGVIFQSGTAYKSLRKMLVEDYLVGVISLPAGVFNPYSGVKTSILWLDKSLARKTDQILFAKITADGFDLGAQRRPVKQNDLPQAFRAIKQYIEILNSPTGSLPAISNDTDAAPVRTLHATSNNASSIIAEISQFDAVNDASSNYAGISQFDAANDVTSNIACISQSDTANDAPVEPLHATAVHPSAINASAKYFASDNPIESTLQSIYPNISIVSKSDIAENGDYNLSGERYKIQEIRNTNYPIVELGEIMKLSSGNGLITSNMKSGNYPVYGGNGITGWHSEYFIEEPTIVIGRVGAYCGSIHISRPCSWITDNGLYITEYLRSDINQMFLALMLKELNINRFAKVGGQPSISQSTVKELKIPLPPLSVQQEIVAEIEAYQKIIDGARQVVENYKPRITIDPDWEMVELGEVCEKITDGSHYSPETTDLGYPYVTVRDLTDGFIDFENCKRIEEKPYLDMLKSGCKPIPNDILFSKDGTVGKTALINFEKDFVVLSSLAIVRPNLKMISEKYLYFLMSTDFFINKAIDNKTGVAIKRIVLKTLKTIQIPVPSFETQHQIVAQIVREQALVNASKELIRLFEQKVKDRIARVWGEDVQKIYPTEEEGISLVAEPINRK